MGQLLLLVDLAHTPRNRLVSGLHMSEWVLVYFPTQSTVVVGNHGLIVSFLFLSHDDSVPYYFIGCKSDPPMLESSMGITNQSIWNLSDGELIKALHLLTERSEALQLPFTKWELGFSSGVVEQYRMRAEVTWKQRQICRRIIEKYSALLQHRVEFTRELEEALKQAS